MAMFPGGQAVRSPKPIWYLPAMTGFQWVHSPDFGEGGQVVLAHRRPSA